MTNILSIKELRTLSGMTQVQFSDYLEIPLNTIKYWETDNPLNSRECKPYIRKLIKEKLVNDNVIKEYDIERIK